MCIYVYIYGKFEVSHGIPHDWTTPCQLEPWRAMARPTGAMVPAAKKPSCVTRPRPVSRTSSTETSVAS